MIIKKLELSNFQVIKKFDANFEGNVYFVTGDNELGKSTLLKAIGALLTGKRDEVLRNGEKNGYAKMVVGDDGEEYEVELRYTLANPRGTLTIRQATTGMRSDNISMLQKIFGYTDFDAVEFSRWSETAEGRRKQIEVVKALLPENVRARLEEIDTEVVRIKAERKEANADVKTYTTLYQQAAKEIAPGEEYKYTVKRDITALMEEQKLNAQLIEKAKSVKAALQQRTEQLNAIPARIEEVENKVAENIKRLRQKIEELNGQIKAEEEQKALYLTHIEEERADLENRKKNAENWLAEYAENNPENLDTAEQLKEAEEYNRKCDIVVNIKNRKAEKERAEERANKLDGQITSLAEEREQLIANAKLPISGLTFTEEGLELNGVPFVAGKVSDSQIMEVATKLIIASNPNVKVFRIARGESLGEKRLQAIIDIAKQNGFQGFIEEVKRGQDDLIIEEYGENNRE